MNLRKLLAECAGEMAQKGRFEIDDVIQCAHSKDPLAWAQETENMVLQAARVIVRNLLRDLGGDDQASDGQLQFDGLNLPSVLAVRSGDGIYYVGTPFANWTELQAAEAERQHNIDAAVRKLQLYRDSLSLLQPIMEPRPELTVQEAWMQLQDAQTA